MPARNRSAYLMKTQLIINILKEEISSVEASLFIHDKISTSTEFDVEFSGVFFFCLIQCVNLVLADTYTIVPDQLPDSVISFPSIYIDRTIKKENTRYNSENFVKKTIDEVRGLPYNITTINVFGTLNPSNSYNIVKEVFVMGGRTHIKHLYVFPQNQDKKCVPRRIDFLSDCTFPAY